MSFAFGVIAIICLIGVIYLSSIDKPGLTLTAFIAGLALVATLNFRYDIKAIWFIIALVLFTATAVMSYFLGNDLENIDFDKPTYLQVFFVLGTALLFMAWAITQIGISTLNPLKAFATQPLVLPSWLIEVFNRAYFILNGPSRLAFFISAAILILSFIPLVLFTKLVPVRRVLGRIVVVSALVWFGTMLMPTKVNAQNLNPVIPPTEVAAVATDAPVEATYPPATFTATMVVIIPTNTPIPAATPIPPTVTPIPPTFTPVTPATVLSDIVPGCAKINATAERYETLWLRTDGSGIYDVTIEETRLTADRLYALAGKNPVNEDHDVMIWDAGSEIISIRGFELWDCGLKAVVSPEAIKELERQFAYKKSESDNSVGVKHNIIIHFQDGSIDPYYDGADVPLPTSMGGVEYSKCTVTEPSHQNTPGDVLDINAVMTSTLGAPGCKSMFVGYDPNGKKIAEFWTGVIERYDYIDGNFWVLPASYTVGDAVNYSNINEAMSLLDITTVQNENHTNIYP